VRVSRMDRLGRMGPVYEHCVRIVLACGLREGIDVAAAFGKDHCSRSGRIRRILPDCCLQVSDPLQISRSNSQGS
jgi:hypothetical protein